MRRYALYRVPVLVPPCFVAVCGWRRSDPHRPTSHAASRSPHPPEPPPSALPAGGPGPEPPDSHRGDPHDSAAVHPPSVQPGDQPRSRRGRPRREILETKRPSEGEVPSAAAPGYSKRGVARRPVGRFIAQRQSGRLRRTAAVQRRDGGEASGGRPGRTCYRGVCLPRVHPRPKKGSFLPDTTLIGGRVWRGGAKRLRTSACCQNTALVWRPRTKGKSTSAPLLNDAVM